MFKVAWTEINSKGEIVSKQKGFKTEIARERFVNKLFESGKLHMILGYMD